MTHGYSNATSMPTMMAVRYLGCVSVDRASAMLSSAQIVTPPRTMPMKRCIPPLLTGGAVASRAARMTRA